MFFVLFLALVIKAHPNAISQGLRKAVMDFFRIGSQTHQQEGK